MEWISDYNAWIGLATLIVLEIVLGIDNLVFIAILADKLPPEQRAKARIIGLSLALGMRLGLLFAISWIVTLKETLIQFGTLDLSGRDIILLLGGFFLLAKGTMELHERLEGHTAHKETKVVHAVFWQVIVQIVILDAVFSLDSVITAVGMVQELSIMVIAMVVAMIVMMVAAKPLMAFVSRHPTVVILCLGFLLMIGFSLVVEGLGFHIPKEYLYAAIGFSVLIEAANQMRQRNRDKALSSIDLRARTSNAVLRLLGGDRAASEPAEDEVEAIAEHTAAAGVFRPEETDMIRGVLDLAARPVSSIMTPRNEIDWIDLADAPETLRRDIRELKHARVLVADGDLDDFAGVALSKDLLAALLDGHELDLKALVREPVVLHESLNVLRVMEQLRRARVPLAVIVDEHGSVVGIATPNDILEAIAGEFPSEDEEAAAAVKSDDGAWTVDGFIDIRRLSTLLGQDLVDEGDRYVTLAGYILSRLGHLPRAGDTLRADGLALRVLDMDGRNIGKVRIEPATAE